MLKIELIGLPGVGKSSIAALVSSSLFFPNGILSNDDILVSKLFRNKACFVIAFNVFLIKHIILTIKLTRILFCFFPINMIIFKRFTALLVKLVCIASAEKHSPKTSMLLLDQGLLQLIWALVRHASCSNCDIIVRIVSLLASFMPSMCFLIKAPIDTIAIRIKERIRPRCDFVNLECHDLKTTLHRDEPILHFVYMSAPCRIKHIIVSNDPPLINANFIGRKIYENFHYMQ